MKYWTQISEWIKSKGVDETESLLEKGKARCLERWYETQSKCYCLTWPKQPLEIKDLNPEPKGWPKRACQMLDVIVTTTVLKGIRVIWAQTVDPLCSWSQGSHPPMDPAQNNHDLKNIHQHQDHIIDRRIKDSRRLLE